MVSGVALALTVWMAWRFEHPESVLPAPQKAEKTSPRTFVPASGTKVAQAMPKQH